MSFFLFFKRFFYQKNKDKRKIKAHHDTEKILKALNKIGLNFKLVEDKDVSKEHLICASQLPVHIFPWVTSLKGVYQVTFSPEILRKINNGFTSVSGGVVRDTSGQILEIGESVNHLAPIILYQMGVIAFGTYHLSEINKSLKKINRKLDEISKFQIDHRASQIDGYWKEFSHISEGINEFHQLGNITEIFS